MMETRRMMRGRRGERLMWIAVLVTLAMGGATHAAMLSPKFWVEADSGVLNGGSPAANGAYVDSWQEQSGNGYHLANATPDANNPKYSASGGPASQPAVAFTRTDHWTGTWIGHAQGNPEPTGPFTAFLLFKVDPVSGGGQNLMSRAYNMGSFYISVLKSDDPTNPNKLHFHLGQWNDSPPDYSLVKEKGITGTSSVTGNWILATTSWDGTNMFLKVNGTQEATTTTTFHSLNYHPDDYFTLGAMRSSGGTAGMLSGSISSAIIYDRFLTPGDENQVGYFLESKYGLDTAYVPEPSTLLLVLGGLGLLGRRPVGKRGA